jgi:AAA family ATPase
LCLSPLIQGSEIFTFFYRSCGGDDDAEESYRNFRNYEQRLTKTPSHTTFPLSVPKMLKKSIDAKVRPLANATLEKASLLGAARIYVNKDALISLTGALDGNKACYVERLGTETETEEGPLKREASLCVMPDKNLSPNVVVMTRAFQDATGFKIGDQVRISLTEGNIADADEVVVQDVTETPQNDTAATHTYIPQWEYPLAKTLDRAELIFPDMLLQGVATDKLRRNFKVLSVNSQRSNLARYKPLGTVVRIAGSDEHAEAATFSEQFGGELVIKDVPGLVSQVKKLNAFLKRFSRSFGMPGERKSCGIVIHGGHNTGKTFILQRLADTRWGKVHWIRSSDKLASIRETFKQATSQQPSMVLIDSLDELIVKDRANRDAVIETICDELDALSATALAQNALPRTVVVATCLDYMTDVPEKLQKSTRLYKNIALPVPRMEERLDILKFLNPPIRPEEKEATLLSIAQNTHAYNGGDLEQLVTNAKDLWGEKFDESGVDPESLKEQQFLTREDMEQALRVTRPTAMHDVNLKPPTVHWQDVGGQESLKKVLTRMIKNTKVMPILLFLSLDA